jgi:hypothetical protein
MIKHLYSTTHLLNPDGRSINFVPGAMLTKVVSIKGLFGARFKSRN